MGRREADDGDDDYRNGNKKKTGQGKDHEERRKENDAFFGLNCPLLKPKMGIKKNSNNNNNNYNFILKISQPHIYININQYNKILSLHNNSSVYIHIHAHIHTQN